MIDYNKRIFGLLSLRELLATVGVVALFAVISWAFFMPNDLQGDVLAQHDVMQGIANGQEGLVYWQQTGEITRWTDALFGGMPTFQIRPTYESSSWVSWVGTLLTLGFPAPVSYLFLLMLGFYLLMRSLRCEWHLAAIGAVAYAFSTYFVILIGAGHIWKLLTLCYIPPTLAGIVWAYRGRLLWGSGLAALMATMQLLSNHVQMTYYSMVLVVALAVAFLVIAIKKHRVLMWCKSTAMLALAACLAVAANLPSLYMTARYTPETIRGGHSELTADTVSTGGLDKDYITAWSYGIDETMTLLIPNAKGGATIRPYRGTNDMLTLDEVNGVDESVGAQEMQVLSQFPQYFGDQPMTNGPVYVGAIVLALFLTGVIVVRGPLKWALVVATVVSVLLSWGHNAMWLTGFLIDHFPMYNKFRTPASALVIAEMAIPALALLALRELVRASGRVVWGKWTVARVAVACFGSMALVCAVVTLSPGVMGAWTTQEWEQLGPQLQQYPQAAAAIETARGLLVYGDAKRSLLFLVIASIPLVAYALGRLRARYVVLAMGVLTLFDMYSVCHRYVNEDTFVPAVTQRQQFDPRPVDTQILNDTTTHYRVMDYQHFAEAMPSYFHKTIGGYHAAKLTRYNDLIEHQIVKGNTRVLDMLNAKYLVLGDDAMQVNEHALGNAWWVDSVAVVAGARAEMSALDSLDVAHVAVTDTAFAQLAAAARDKSPGDTIRLTTYAPNRVTYRAHSAEGGVAVFSEVYFPWGWTVTIDDKPATLSRVNYVLRAMEVPAGDHTIVMKFDPPEVGMTTNIATTAIIVIFLLLLAALNQSVWVAMRRR